MRRLLFLAGLVCLVAGLVGQSMAQGSGNRDEFVQEVLVLVNEARAAEGLSPVSLSLTLASAAQAHAEAMAADDFFDHQNPLTGSTPQARATAAGYDGLVGENIAAGDETPADVVASWLSSPGHRANILDPDYTEMGVGYAFQADDAFPSTDGPYQTYWVQLFGAPGVDEVTLPVGDEQVYFWTVSGGEGQIIAGNLKDGSTIPFTPLNQESSCVGCHAVSPAGGRIAAILDSGVGPVAVKTLEGDDIAIPSIAGSFLAWSPDGLLLAVAAEDGNIYIVDVEAGMVAPLAGASDDNVFETMPAWSPDGTTIAFVRSEDSDYGFQVTAPSQIYVVPATGGEAVPVTGADETGFNYYPAWSPDGQWLAFTYHQDGEDSYADNEADIYLVPAGGGERIFMSANSNASDSWPSWSRDSNWLAFNSNRNNGQFDVFVVPINADGSSGDVVLFPGADDPNVFEHLPVWGEPPRIAQIEPTPTVAPTATPVPLPTPSGTPVASTLLTMTVDAEPEEVLVDEAVTVQITLSGDSETCGQSVETRPVDAILVLDNSGSMEGVALEQSKAAARAFVEELDLANDRVGVVVFSDSARLIHALSSDTDSLLAAIDSIVIEGGTAIHAGLEEAFRELNSNLRTGATPVIVLLSDGESDRSAAQRAADTAKAAGMKIVAVGLGDSLDPDLMRAIASEDDEGQPQYFESPDGTDLEQIYVTIARTIRDTYLATDVTVRFDLEQYDFFVVPESLNPPGDVTGEAITWRQDTLEDGTSVFTFQVRPRQPGEMIDVGRLTEAFFLECEQTLSVIQLPPGPPITVLPGEDQFRPLPNPCTVWWQVFPWWLLAPLLLLILLLLFLLTPWGRRLLSKLRKKPLLCKLMFVLTLLYLLLLAALIANALIGDLCPVDNIYFWRFDTQNGDVGVFESRFASEATRPVTHLNRGASCVACHSGNGTSQTLSAVQGDQNGPIIANQVDGDEVILPVMNGSYLAWSPDGTQAAVSLNDQDIYVLNVISNTLQALPGASDPTIIETMPAWSADGQIIAFVRTTATDPDGSANITAPADIYTVPAGGGTALPIIGASGDGFNYYPAYSPDGQWLAFTRHEQGTDTYANDAADLYLVPAGGGERIYLRANSELADSWPTWSSDSRWLGFNSNRRGQFDLFAAEIGPGGQSSDVYYFPAGFDDVNEEFHPVWMPPPDIPWWQRLIALWPWLLPLLLLLFLGWYFCRERQYTLSGTVSDAITRQPIAGAAVKITQPERPEMHMATGGSGNYETRLPKGATVVTVIAGGYLGQTRHAEVSGDTTVDFMLYPLIEPVGMLAPPPPLQQWTPLPVWQPDPTLIIGLGGTGRHVLTHVKKNLRDAGAGVISERVRLVLIDTHDYELLEGQEVPVSFAGVTLTHEDIVEFGGNLGDLVAEDATIEPELQGWFPTYEYRTRLSAAELDLSLGTRQRRPPARAALVRDVNQGAKAALWQLLYNETGQALDENQRLRVILVGSLAGGFGSAVVADIAYLARRAAKAHEARGTSIEAYLATDGAFARIANRPDTHAANSFASLRELERFQLAQGYPFRMVYNHAQTNDPVLAGRINWRLLDEIYLFDTPPNVTPVSEAQERAFYNPATGIFPAIADAITLWLDKASRRGPLSDYRNSVQGSVTAEQQARGRAVVGGLGNFVYRLPMYDLLAQLQVRWCRALLAYLMVGEEDVAFRLDPALNREYNPRAVAEHAHQFLIGVAGYVEPSCPPTTALVGLLAHEGISPNLLNKVQEIVVEDSARESQAYQNYLLGSLLVILNGMTASDIARARVGKAGYALSFLETIFNALRQAADTIKIAPPDLPGDVGAKLQHLADLLPQLAEETRRLAVNLRFQTGLISQQLRPENSNDDSPGLYEQLTRLEQEKAAVLAEMDTVLVRHYVHPPDLLDRWYQTYLAQDPFLAEAMQRLFWEADSSGRLRLALQTWQTEPVRLEADETSQHGFQAALLEMAAYATREIWQQETLASVLAQTALHHDRMPETMSRLRVGSEPLLHYDTFRASQTMWGMVLGANETADLRALADALRLELPADHQLSQVALTDPYTLSLMQTADVIPLDAIDSISTAERTYRRWYGLLPRSGVDPRAEPTAVFQAERIALLLEQQLQPELRQAARLLRPVIVTALDSGGVARLYALAYAAGWVQRVRDVLYLNLPDGTSFALTKPEEGNREHPEHAMVVALVRFVSLPGSQIVMVQNALNQAGEETIRLWRQWTSVEWQQNQLARPLLAGDPDAADLAAVVALVVRDELRKRS